MKMQLITVAVLVAFLSLLVAPMQTSAKPKPTGAVSIPATISSESREFQGQFNLKGMKTTDKGDIAVVGDLIGADGKVAKENVEWPIDLAATHLANNPAGLTGGFEALATCDILKLVLQPIHLDLLGLVVDLSQVILTITGETGPGNLLGNLLCGILGALDPAALLSGLLSNLGQINTLLGSGLLTALAVGALSVIGGVMQLANFTQSGNQIFANGTLGGQAVSAPLDLAATRAANLRAGLAGGFEAQATCDILNLVLGPIHLDLLGLVVDLNQVTLNITAEQAPGNLLGNLLCAVVNLLNGPSPLAGLLNQLNHILRVLSGA